MDPETGITPTTPEKETRRYDAIFVFPGYPFPQRSLQGREKYEGIVEQIAGRPRTTHPSGLLFDSRLKDIAAALMVRNGESNVIVTMSRPTRSWMEVSHAQLLADHLRLLVNTQRRGIEIIQEEESYDTVTEVAKVKEIAKERRFNNVAIIVTDEATKKRVRTLISSRGEGFPNHTIHTIESILMDHRYGTPKVRAHLAEIMSKYHRSAFLRFWRIREGFAHLLDRVNPRLLSTLSQRTR